MADNNKTDYRVANGELLSVDTNVRLFTVQLRPIVERINSLESGLTPLSDHALADKTQEFKKRLEAGETLDDILPEAFAVCREMSRRKLEHAPFRCAVDRRHDSP